MILDEILEKRKIQLAGEKGKISLDELKKLIKAAPETRSFKNALKAERISVIAEVKKASPSKGLIQPDFDPVKIAREYEKAGAAAISCLTEEHYFQGSSEYLREIRKNVNIPVLRKDFIFDSYQVYEARAIGADAVLLIAASLDDKKLEELFTLAKKLGMDVLGEAHDEAEVMRLANIGFDIIGVNNRNLKTFKVSLENTKRLSKLIPENAVFVCESGIKTNADMRFAHDCTADAVLIGETLMRSGAEGIADCMAALREGV